MADSPVQIDIAARFKKDVRELRKHYRHIQQDVNAFIDTLTPGDQVQGVGYTAYKARVKNSDSRRGKSGGYRIIYYIRTVDRLILLTIYTKTKQTDISPEEIRKIIEEVENIESEE